MKIGVYVRVSTAKPKKSKPETVVEKGQDTEMQKRDILAYLNAQGWTDFEVYDDTGYSGTKDARPALKRLMADCRAGRVQTVICWKLDRLFRSLRHLINTLEEFSKMGVQFVALRDAIDLSTHTGRFMMQILGAVAEFESAIIRERTNAGLDTARAKGIQLGRKPQEIGRDHILALVDQGITHAEIAKSFGVTTKTIQRKLAAVK